MSNNVFMLLYKFRIVVFLVVLVNKLYNDIYLRQTSEQYFIL